MEKVKEEMGSLEAERDTLSSQVFVLEEQVRRLFKLGANRFKYFWPLNHTVVQCPSLVHVCNIPLSGNRILRKRV